MPALEALRRALDVTAELGEVVRTMKTLSAVSIRQCERAVAALADYDAAVSSALGAVLKELPGSHLEAEGGRCALVLLGSDHGLCGRFNEALVEAAQAEPPPFRLLVVGERAADLCAAGPLGEGRRLPSPSAAAAIGATVAAVLAVLADWREREGVGEIRLRFNRSVEGEPHRSVAATLLPTRAAAAEPVWPGAPRRPGLPVRAAALLEPLLTEKLFVELYRALAESLASEHESRLLAMQSAERNIRDRLAELEGRYRRTRQEVVTAELLDLVAGFEVLAKRA